MTVEITAHGMLEKQRRYVVCMNVSGTRDEFMSTRLFLSLKNFPRKFPGWLGFSLDLYGIIETKKKKTLALNDWSKNRWEFVI